MVYPSRMDIRKLMPVFRHMTGSCKTNVPLFEDPFLSGGVREYTPEDSMRKIHWKASARMGNWQVKTAEYTASTPVVILLNLESPGVFVSVDLMEESIRLAYSFVYYLSKEGVETKLVISGDENIPWKEPEEPRLRRHAVLWHWFLMSTRLAKGKIL